MGRAGLISLLVFLGGMEPGGGGGGHGCVCVHVCMRALIH